MTREHVEANGVVHITHGRFQDLTYCNLVIIVENSEGDLIVDNYPAWVTLKPSTCVACEAVVAIIPT